jgi:hypothetical protein
MPRDENYFIFEKQMQKFIKVSKLKKLLIFPSF